MILFAAMALAGGALVGLSRQVNGRLARATTPLVASFWNHLVGFAALALVALVALGWPSGLSGVPPWAWAGGPIGVLFAALGSWLLPRLGAARTALLVIAGQMVSGAALDTLRGAEGMGWRAGGVLLILAGVAVARR